MVRQGCRVYPELLPMWCFCTRNATGRPGQSTYIAVDNQGCCRLKTSPLYGAFQSLASFPSYPVFTPNSNQMNALPLFLQPTFGSRMLSLDYFERQDERRLAVPARLHGKSCDLAIQTQRSETPQSQGSGTNYFKWTTQSIQEALDAGRLEMSKDSCRRPSR